MIELFYLFLLFIFHAYFRIEDPVFVWFCGTRSLMSDVDIGIFFIRVAIAVNIIDAIIIINQIIINIIVSFT